MPVLFLFLWLPCRGQAGSLPFQPGERLVYRIVYMGIPAGTATLEVRKDKENSLYHLAATARSSKLFSVFYRVRDELNSFINPRTMAPVRFESHQVEGPSYRADKFITFDREKSLAIMGEERIPITETTQDMLSAIYCLRAQTFKVGSSIFIDVNTGRKNHRIEVKVLEETELKRKGKRRPAFLLQPVLEHVSLGGVLEEKREILVWLSKDEKRVPLMIKGRVVFGTVSFFLIHEETG